jgi:tetratricopeptide (TPR) repeat protein
VESWAGRRARVRAVRRVVAVAVLLLVAVGAWAWVRFERAETLKSALAEGPSALDHGEYELAEREFSQAVRLSPNSPVAVRGLGEAYLHRQKWDEAIAMLEKARQLQPGDAQTVYSLGLAYAARGRDPRDVQRARDLLTEAERRAIPDPQIRYARGLTYLDEGRLKEAIAALEATAPTTSVDEEALVHLSEAYRRAGREADAERTLARYQKRSEKRRLLHDLRVRVEAQPEDRQARRQLAEACLGAGRYGEAIKHLQELENRGEKNAELYDLFSRAWYGLGQTGYGDESHQIAEQLRRFAKP